MAVRLPRRSLRGSALSPSVVLEPSPGRVERLTDSHESVLPPWIGLVLFCRLGEVDVLIGGMQARGVCHHDFLSRYCQVDPDVIAVAGLVMTSCELDQN